MSQRRDGVGIFWPAAIPAVRSPESLHQTLSSRASLFTAERHVTRAS